MEVGSLWHGESRGSPRGDRGVNLATSRADKKVHGDSGQFHWALVQISLLW
jgi:hypothetical protein